MADYYEVIHPAVEFQDSDGNAASISILRKWTEQDDGSYSPASNATVSISSVSLTGNLPDTAAGDLAAINAALAATLTAQLSGDLPDTAAGDLAAIVSALGGTLTAQLSGNLPDTGAGDLSAINSAVSGTLTVDATGQGDVPVKADGITISQTPTITAGAYSEGDAVGGKLTFANAAKVSGGGGMLSTVIIVDDAGQDVELELWLFNQDFTSMSDNAAWAPSEADLENLVGVISTEDSAQGWLAAGTPSAVTINEMMRYDCVGSTSLYGQLVTRGTPTFVATDDVTVKIGLLQD